MQRRHTMPFGAALKDSGGVAFRFWAPKVDKVEIEIDGRRRVMQRQDGGWFSLEVAEARAGTRYHYVIGDQRVPDPASRFQPEDVHGPSEVVDPGAFDWSDGDWRGRSWDGTVISEIHVGAFTPGGTFDSAIERLDHLKRVGITAIEVMPISDWPGRRNWGYDGVLPFAPDAALGGPIGFKKLIDAAHRRGLMVLLDVVYNHFGPEGNYLGLYAPTFFTDHYHTPWGQAINFEDAAAKPVREFVIHNVLYWLEEFGLDGLRFDAVDQIRDASDPHILTELAQRAHERFDGEREIHLVLENDHNQARYLPRGEQRRPLYFTAQWNDDAHHVMHVIATGESGGYYSDYQTEPVALLGRALTQGFVYQGDPSPYRGGQTRGEESGHLPPGAFVHFLQNHDQIGNRALGERLESLAPPHAAEALLTVLLLAPQPPLLFMGDEWGTRRPFLFFCDFHDELAKAVREGRRREFARFPEFSDAKKRASIPDPNAEETFLASRLDWSELDQPAHAARLVLVRELLKIRRKSIVPLIAGIETGEALFIEFGACGLLVEWKAGDDVVLRLTANLGPGSTADPIARFHEHILYATAGAEPLSQAIDLPPWSVVWEAGPPPLQAHLV
jgi:maltooligosyltrehalose trehalohydrolase